MIDPLRFRLFIALLLAAIVAQMVFALFPGLDLRVSAMFFDATGAFPAHSGPWVLLNDLIRMGGEALAFAIVIGVIAGKIGGVLRQAEMRCAAYLAANLLLAPGLLVNGLLKSHVGRARPDQVAEFGGLATFTPAWQVTDQCARNCSFSSGDVALIATLVLGGLVLAWPHLSRLQKSLGTLGGLALVLGTGLLRIALGRHFLSDVVFSMLFSAAMALALYPLFGIGAARLELRPRRIGQGARQVLQRTTTQLMSRSRPVMASAASRLRATLPPQPPV
ncbi:membrane-associated PAP2 superfamily phosphatase [Rhodobacter viridis]|uniref:Membrane-associated PAP2 superfamily phosphatase n=1 Tax=Rhodobacter viridis TaxID=1054202 RepID=A0A318TWJ1_9RHOB|nr:phosphatase PAP2 family protein [Rhodobacter viridis]PYF08127.1 membrane-associated PAP2 superfamily phosphatase [Rhodobacter viridis]